MFMCAATSASPPETGQGRGQGHGEGQGGADGVRELGPCGGKGGG